MISFTFDENTNKFFHTMTTKNSAIRGEEILPLFPQDTYSCADEYLAEGVLSIEPMTAKEIEGEETQDELLGRVDHFVEEKFDGTRGIMQFTDKGNRIFSRRISKKTGFYSENSDRLPQLRDYVHHGLIGTIIDGEMFINGQQFKEVSSTLNCLWEESLHRQLDKGLISFHAFDILYYKGKDLRQLPLHRRKKYLRDVISTFNNPYLEEVPFYSQRVPVTINAIDLSKIESEKDKYPTLYIETCDKKYLEHVIKLSHKAYYEYIVLNGGEGVILKPRAGKYYHKRGREYQKIKKFLTRDLIILDFEPPTKEYKGKFPKPDLWQYWLTDKNEVLDLEESPEKKLDLINYYPDQCTPVSKYFAKGWVGNLILGVTIPYTEIEKLPKNKQFNITDIPCVDGHKVIEVCVCSGYNEEVRQYMTKNQKELIGTVVEVKANELFKDTGKMRHPRFLRFRPDKSANQCTWKDHINK